jgi:hypothetical protein
MAVTYRRVCGTDVQAVWGRDQLLAGSVVTEEAAVDGQGVAGDPGGVGGGEEGNSGCDVVRLAYSAEGVQRPEAVSAAFLVVPHAGSNGAGSHSVDADVVWAEGERLAVRETTPALAEE